MEPVTRGDPESPLRWTCKSVRQLATELKRTGHHTSHRMVAELLHAMDYSLQANRKTLEGSSRPDRDAQFHHISNKIREFQADRQPVISVDTKKKELVGDFKNNGREIRPKGDPEPERGLGQRGGRSRDGYLRRPEHPAMVGVDGSRGVPPSGEVADHSGFRGK